MPTTPWRTKIAPRANTEYLVLASRLPLRSMAHVPWFLRRTVSVVRQLERAEGLVGYSLRAAPRARTFWTLSAWIGEPSIDAFVRELPHAAVMVKLRPHMGRSLFATWSVPGAALPVSWDDAVDHLRSAAGAPPAPR